MDSRIRLSDRIRQAARFKHLSLRTEISYLNWIKRLYLFYKKQDPATLNTAHIREFLSDLAIKHHVSPSTQNQALCALVFFYKHVLQMELPRIENIARPKIKKSIPVVFTRDEVKAILSKMTGVHRLMAGLLYGSGLRLMECVRLRVKDLEFERNQILVRDSKGQNARITILPASLKPALKLQLDKIELLHEDDLNAGYGVVHLPHALERKYPNAGATWAWRAFATYEVPSTSNNRGVQNPYSFFNNTTKGILGEGYRSSICGSLYHWAM